VLPYAGFVAYLAARARSLKERVAQLVHTAAKQCGFVLPKKPEPEKKAA